MYLPGTGCQIKPLGEREANAAVKMSLWELHCEAPGDVDGPAAATVNTGVRKNPEKDQ